MKKIIITLSIISSLFFTACNTTGVGMGSHTQTGVGVGAASGALLGGIIGHQSGEDGEGAAIGAAAGAILGGLLGNSKDAHVKMSNIEAQRQREAMVAQANENRRAAAERRRDQIRLGRAIESPDVLAARQRAEAAEAKLTRMRQEQAEALRRAKELEALQAREAAAYEEISQISTY